VVAVADISHEQRLVIEQATTTFFVLLVRDASTISARTACAAASVPAETWIT
jgi:hypothetical protein